MNKRSYIVGLSVTVTVLAASAWGQGGGTAPGSGSGSDAGSAGSAATSPGSDGSGGSDGSAGSATGAVASGSAATSNLKAQSSLPQITAARGGSFGIPSTAQTAGLHASVDAKVFTDGSSTDAFAQLAGLYVSDHVSIDVVGQSVSQDMQRFVLADSMAKPEIDVETLSSAGMRVRLRRTPILLVSKMQTPECMTALEQTVDGTTEQGTVVKVALARLLGNGGLGLAIGDSGDPDLDQQIEKGQKKIAEQEKALAESKTDERFSATDLDAQKQALADTKKSEETKDGTDRDGVKYTFKVSELDPKVKKVQAACHLDNIRGFSGWTFTLGAHALRRASISKEGNASVGGALEAIAQKDKLNWTAFIGASFEYLNHALDKDSGAQFDFVSFHAMRLSAGYEFRASHSSDGNDLLPRVGLYGVASMGWWQNPYNSQSTVGAATAGKHGITSTELEGGVYASGKFTNNFTGMIALRVLKPFGDFNQGTTFLISLIPAVSAGK